MPSTPPPAREHLRTGDDYDPWTQAMRCRQHIDPRRRGHVAHRCLNRTTNASGLCWRHEPKETTR